MSANIDLYVDSGGSGILSGGSALGANLPQLTRNDVYTFRIRVQDVAVGQQASDIDLTGSSLKLGIGDIDSYPTDGQFLLTLAGPVTSSAISFNATTTQFFNAISGIAGNATVTTYGVESNAWLITAATANTALSFGGNSNTLFPSSSVLIGTRRNPAVGVNAQQIVQLRRNPAVYANNFTNASTAGVSTLTKVQDGGTSANEAYKLTFGPDALSGLFSLDFGGTSTTAIPIRTSAATLSIALQSIPDIGTGNISVTEIGQGYSIAFIGTLANTNIATALSLDASAIEYAPWKVATVTLATAELDEIFAEEGTSTVDLTLEIELVDGGQPKTLAQSPVTIRRDLITSGSVVPAPKDSYYTKAEADALFVEDSATNVNATNRKLNSSDGTERLRYEGGLGFFGATAVTRQQNLSVVSGLVNLGLFTSSSTYGVLPLSPQTLTTTASIYFGQVNSNSTNSVSVVVTGCKLNDIVLLGLPADINNGLAFASHVTTGNGVEVDCINATNGNITPATATYRITVIGY